jgi:hypothetical protein
MKGLSELNAPIQRSHFSFGAALRVLKAGGRVTRLGWNGPGQFLAMQVPDENSKMSLPYIYIHTVQGDRVPWLASQTDLLMDDWERLYESPWGKPSWI